MCPDCIKKALEHRKQNNKMVQDRIDQGLPLSTPECVIGMIGHIHLGFPCEHQKDEKNKDLSEDEVEFSQQFKQSIDGPTPTEPVNPHVPKEYLHPSSPNDPKPGDTRQFFTMGNDKTFKIIVQTETIEYKPTIGWSTHKFKLQVLFETPVSYGSTEMKRELKYTSEEEYGYWGCSMQRKSTNHAMLKDAMNYINGCIDRYEIN